VWFFENSSLSSQAPNLQRASNFARWFFENSSLSSQAPNLQRASNFARKVSSPLVSISRPHDNGIELDKLPGTHSNLNFFGSKLGYFVRNSSVQKFELRYSDTFVCFGLKISNPSLVDLHMSSPAGQSNILLATVYSSSMDCSTLCTLEFVKFNVPGP
jgi:hypothetical protein